MYAYKYLQLLWGMVSICLGFKETAKLFSKVSFPPVTYERSSFSASLPAFDTVIIFKISDLIDL